MHSFPSICPPTYHRFSLLFYLNLSAFPLPFSLSLPLLLPIPLPCRHPLGLLLPLSSLHSPKVLELSLSFTSLTPPTTSFSPFHITQCSSPPPSTPFHLHIPHLHSPPLTKSITLSCISVFLPPHDPSLHFYTTTLHTQCCFHRLFSTFFSKVSISTYLLSFLHTAFLCCRSYMRL